MISPVGASEMGQLKPMPASIARLAAIVADPDASVGDVADVIKLDQALTANMLRLANSVWGGSATPIEHLREAVIRLGTARVLSLAVGRHVMEPMSHSCEGYELAEHELWRHSVAAALAVERLGQLTDRPIPGTAFTAALLHDIGKLMLNRHLDKARLAQIQQLIEDDEFTYIEAERRVLGTDHAEVGGMIACQWSLPKALGEAIAWHHDPEAQPSAVLDAVHVANTVAKLLGIGLGTEQMHTSASSEAPHRLGLSSSDLESLCAIVMDELERTEALYEGKVDGS